MNRENAKKLLCHYFKLVFERSGLKWDSDNEAEVREIVDLMIVAALEP